MPRAAPSAAPSGAPRGALAGDPHPGQGPGGDRVAAGHGGRVLLGGDHPAVRQLRYSLSTTHVATGSIIGTGLGKKGAEVRWNVAGRMASAWVFTLPSAALVGAAAYALAHLVGGSAGVIVDLIILAAIGWGIYEVYQIGHPAPAKH